MSDTWILHHLSATKQWIETGAPVLRRFRSFRSPDTVTLYYSIWVLDKSDKNKANTYSLIKGSIFHLKINEAAMNRILRSFEKIIANIGWKYKKKIGPSVLT